MKNYPADILEDLASYLIYHRNLGIESYPMSEQLQELLAEALPVKQRTAVVSPSPPESGRKVIKPGPTTPSQTRQKDAAERVTLTTLAEEFKQCQACSLSGESIQGSIGRGGEKPRLLIVGHWLEADRKESISAGAVFGVQQDMMVERMIGAIKLTPDTVYVTNLVKCIVPSGTQPKAADVRKCFDHLERQVAALKPQIILTMGMVPSRLFLNRSDPLSRLRGKLHSYTSLDGTEIPLVATYHPTFLLENEGMKSATWLDLQMVAKQLAIKIT